MPIFKTFKFFYWGKGCGEIGSHPGLNPQNGNSMMG